ncbi:hypothetical protein CYMTET_21735 [Cymbomonas tetramitiformis]|uniref:EF-hand domain-containing protein n=1 Tax=Cymbomonas tetramitiformis TaxID=36881 RepID=A0AAE0L2P3_9CHLO|nr:hypothetical protein CYMTET_21735 [Cymbomonas tetramitiformis]|eukprot:gene19035-22757_t
MATTAEKLKTLDVRKLRKEWTIYIHGAQFREMVEDVFYKSCNVKQELSGAAADNKLDTSEMQIAMELMHNRLGSLIDMGELATPDMSVAALLERFDTNNDGSLDLEEFYRFTLVYFSELRWPMWKIVTKGAIVGAGVHIAIKHVGRPLFFKALYKAIPLGLRLSNYFGKSIVFGQARSRVDKLRLMFSDGNPLRVSDKEQELIDLKAKEERLGKRKAFFKGLSQFSLVGGIAAVAGLI